MTEVIVSSKLFVGSLPWNIDDESLKTAFTPYGSVVSARIIKDRRTNRSKGFGFVEMSSEDEANSAIEGLNGKDFNGRTITVNIAREQK